MQRSNSNRLGVERRRSRVRSDSVGPAQGGYTVYSGPPSRSDKIRRGTYLDHYSSKVDQPAYKRTDDPHKVRGDEQLLSTTTGTEPTSLLPSFEHVPIQAYWNHIEALQNQISRIEMQCAAINASLNAWKSFLNAAEQMNACEPASKDSKFVMDEEEEASSPRYDQLKNNVMPSNLPGGIKADLPPVQKRRSRGIVPPIAPHSRSHSRQQTTSYTMPWRQEDIPEPTHNAQTQPAPESWQEVSDRKQSTRKPVSSASPGKGSEPLTGTSLTRWHLMQVKRLLDEPTSGAQPTGKSDPLLSPPPPSSGDVPRPGPAGLPLRRPEHRDARGLRRQQTTSIEFIDTQDEVVAGPSTAKERASARSSHIIETAKSKSHPEEVDKENAPIEEKGQASPRSETDASGFSGYFPTVTQHTSSIKPTCVPSLGLEPTRLPPSAWLSGQATQGDTYGA